MRTTSLEEDFNRAALCAVRGGYPIGYEQPYTSSRDIIASTNLIFHEMQARRVAEQQAYDDDGGCAVGAALRFRPTRRGKIRDRGSMTWAQWAGPTIREMLLYDDSSVYIPHDDA
jgi:hypothetical protein